MVQAAREKGRGRKSEQKSIRPVEHSRVEEGRRMKSGQDMDGTGGNDWNGRF